MVEKLITFQQFRDRFREGLGGSGFKGRFIQKTQEKKAHKTPKYGQKVSQKRKVG
jgi:hypothetical protein